MSNFLQSPEVRVVEASAGSGKTYALAKRYVQLLLNISLTTSFAFKSILALTFTNKAAIEMKSRILELLKRIALGKLSPAEEQDILLPLGLNAFKAQQRALEIMDELIRHYHYFGVLTIDSFMNMLLCGCAFRINLSAHFKIKRNVDDYLQLSVDELIDRAYEDKEIRVLFDDFIRQYLFLENRTGWFPKKDLLSVLSTLFNQHNTYQMPFLLFAQDQVDVLRNKQQFLSAVNDLKPLLPSATDKRFLTSFDKFLSEHPHGFDIDHVSRYFAREQVPLTGGQLPSEALQEQWQLCAQLLNLICLQESYAVFNPYVRLFNAMMEGFERIQTKDDVLFLGQLNKKAGDLFDSGQMTVEELFYRLATRYHHYLIDEFQDTSQAQWKNLHTMVEEALSTGGSLFFVGDKKQAIYSFRGGESRLFDQLKDRYVDFNVVSETLTRNYRSQAQIVHFNNQVFKMDNLLRFMDALQAQDRMADKEIAFSLEDRERLSLVFASAQQEARADLPHGVVKVMTVEGHKKEERLHLTREYVINALTDAISRFAKGQIAVLTRNNDEVREVTQWLIHEGVAVQSERTSDIKAHPLIKELIALLHFLNKPSDDLFFAEFISGDLFVLSSGLSSAQIQDFIFSSNVLRKTIRDLVLFQQFKIAHVKVWETFFEDFYSQRGIYPLYELMVNITQRFRCFELFPEAQGFIMHFLELIKRKEEESCDIETFVMYFEGITDEDRYVPSANQDAVKVLTIHKSKGLEFDVVIIPFLEMSIKAGSSDMDGAQSFIWDQVEEDGNWGIRLMRLKETYTRFSPMLKERYAQEFKESFFAELNNVYVALTRAVWEMYVFIPARVGNSVNPVPLLFPQNSLTMGKGVAPMTNHQHKEARMPLPMLASKRWMNQIQEEFIKENSGQAQARLKGDMIHFCLSLIGRLNVDNQERVIESAVALTLAKFTGDLEEGFLRKKIDAILTHPSWKGFFYLPDEARVFCEQEIVNRYGDTKRLDRLIINGKDITVIDFKTSRIDEKQHLLQIEEYVSLLKVLYASSRINAKVLYIDE